MWLLQFLSSPSCFSCCGSQHAATHRPKLDDAIRSKVLINLLVVGQPNSSRVLEAQCFCFWPMSQCNRPMTHDIFYLMAVYSNILLRRKCHNPKDSPRSLPLSKVKNNTFELIAITDPAFNAFIQLDQVPCPPCKSDGKESYKGEKKTQTARTSPKIRMIASTLYVNECINSSPEHFRTRRFCSGEVPLVSDTKHNFTLIILSFIFQQG